MLSQNILILGGEGIVTSISVGSLLDDNMWHDVHISRKHRDVTFSVDRVVVPAKIRGDFLKLHLKREVRMHLYLNVFYLIKLNQT